MQRTHTANNRFKKTSFEESESEVEEMIITKEDIIPEDIMLGEATTRIAIVNLDWESIDSKDLYKIIAGFIPEEEIKHVRVYKTPLGKKVLEKEEAQGPQVHISNDKEEQQKNIRDYMRIRMKYFYAVAEFHSLESAKTVYDQIDGLEIEETFNFIDARFIPEETNITDDLENECTTMSKLTKTIPKNTLYHTNAKIQWEEDLIRDKSLKDLFTEETIDINLADELIDMSDDNTKQEYYKKQLKDSLALTEPTDKENHSPYKPEDPTQTKKDPKQKDIKEKDTKKKKVHSLEDEIVKEEESLSETEDSSLDIPLQPDSRFTKNQNNADFAVDQMHPAYLAKKRKTQ
ncbi:hypothetical protein NEOKW01_0359 [Nematocida sp. AWRm80]|nr:hypothetical protein NEOKW01_0359 [Nematocida sp. AWRm80]